MPPEAEQGVLVTAARDLPAGRILDAESLATASVPAEAVPPGAQADPGPLLGRRLATPLLQGSPVTELSLAGAGLLSGTPPGTVAVPLRPADPSVLDLLEPGFSPAFRPHFIDNTAFPPDWPERTGSCARECTACGYCDSVFGKVNASLQERTT